VSVSPSWRTNLPITFVPFPPRFPEPLRRQRRKERLRFYLYREIKNPFSTRAGSKGMMRSDPLVLSPVGIARIALSAVQFLLYFVVLGLLTGDKEATKS
jgi:hypothetical protein